jgi:hypothetical protein
MAVFIYILYAVIDTNLVSKQLAFIEEMMQKKGLPQASIDAAMSMQKKLMKPAIMAPISIFGSMFRGLIMSLIAAAFLRKEGNPLIDAPVSE